MKRTDPIRVGDIIRRVMQEEDTSGEMLRRQASYLWTEVVGPGINGYTYRRNVTPDGTLHVYISSAPLKNELSFMRTRLMNELNARVGADVITNIVIH